MRQRTRQQLINISLNQINSLMTKNGRALGAYIKPTTGSTLLNNISKLSSVLDSITGGRYSTYNKVATLEAIVLRAKYERSQEIDVLNKRLEVHGHQPLSDQETNSLLKHGLTSFKDGYKDYMEEKNADTNDDNDIPVEPAESPEPSGPTNSESASETAPGATNSSSSSSNSSSEPNTNSNSSNSNTSSNSSNSSNSSSSNDDGIKLPPNIRRDGPNSFTGGTPIKPGGESTDLTGSPLPDGTRVNPDGNSFAGPGADLLNPDGDKPKEPTEPAAPGEPGGPAEPEPGNSEGGNGGEGAEPAGEGNGGANERIPRDPLILDLDGDGIELTELANSQAYFDLDGNGFATKTSWVSKDDGLLVYDRNEDGKINDISELFGSLEKGGFEELSELDSNNDGVINNQDEAFEKLQIWQDANGDGNSQKDELTAITDKEISSIKLHYSDVINQTDTDGRVVRESSFEYANGEEGKLVESGLVGDVEFAIRPEFSRYVGDVEITDDVKQVANIKGYGLMPDLQIAMALDNNLKQSVINQVNDGEILSNPQAFEALLYQWANVNDIAITDIDSEPQLQANEDTQSVKFSLAGVELTLKQLGVIKKYTGIDRLRLGDGQWRENGEIKNTGKLYQQAWNEIYRNLSVKFAVANGVLEDVLPQLTYNFDKDVLVAAFDVEKSAEKLYQYYTQQIEANKTNEKTVNKLLLVLTALVEISPSTTETLKQAFIDNGLSEHIFSNPIFKSLGIIDIEGSSSNDNLHGSNKNDFIVGMQGNDELKGGAGNDELYGGEGNDYLEGGAGNDIYHFGRGDGHDTINNYDGQYKTSVDTLQFGPDIQPADIKVSRNQSNLYLEIIGTDDRITIRDFFHSSSYQLDQVKFAEGSVWTTADLHDKSRYIEGTDGVDQLSGFGTNDELTGHAGNDYLEGKSGNDTYHFGRGDGQDRINNYDSNKESTDTLKLTQLTKNDIWFRKQGNNMIVDVIGSADQTTIQNWFSGANYQLDKIETENSVLDLSQLDNLVQAMAAFNDYETADGNLTPEALAAISPLLATAWQPK
ncbi:hypothetical protein H0A36_12840 [Endozoicomonas sp. SM1973]|uniref:Haemolysin-type calcium binding-related domain-containing protein n=1 Tax=Spartinivicinus marinus TaxID=2994442 RepID=A0A853HYT7_9GAMM|nr:calcium-binding protein [Spartinivicinus marinus]MCX4026528.1 calcium-binding protein [Spartinivicinus marinus]NYZ66900.1 hypothetical protein [Spartinivicinus marinus]